MTLYCCGAGLLCVWHVLGFRRFSSLTGTPPAAPPTLADASSSTSDEATIGPLLNEAIGAGRRLQRALEIQLEVGHQTGRVPNEKVTMSPSEAGQLIDSAADEYMRALQRLRRVSLTSVPGGNDHTSARHSRPTALSVTNT